MAYFLFFFFYQKQTDELVDFSFLLNFTPIFLIYLFHLWCTLIFFSLPIKLFTDKKSLVRRNLKIYQHVYAFYYLFIYFDRLTTLMHLDNKSLRFLVTTKLITHIRILMSSNAIILFPFTCCLQYSIPKWLIFFSFFFQIMRNPPWYQPTVKET